MATSAHSPSPLAGEGLGCGVAPRQAAQKSHFDDHARSSILIERARRMRANPTDAERALWRILRDSRLNGLRWRRQEVIEDRYIVDFLCYAHRLIVEADGSQHSESKSDAGRDSWLKQQGFDILRFWNNEILGNVEGVVLAILNAVEPSGAQARVDPTPNPLPQGERALNGAS